MNSLDHSRDIHMHEAAGFEQLEVLCDSNTFELEVCEQVEKNFSAELNGQGREGSLRSHVRKLRLILRRKNWCVSECRTHAM
jgi:hypothetical protein